MIDKRVADVIRTTAKEVGTPAVVVEAVLAGVLPSVRLVAQHPKAGEEQRVGGCRIGGAPDLPPGVEWPRLPTAASPGTPLSFLLQVNLAEAAFADREQLLPKYGMLYFFFQPGEDGVEGEDGVFSPDAVSLDNHAEATVLFAQGPELRRTTVPPDLPADQFSRDIALVPCLEWTVPPPDGIDLDQQLIAENLGLWNELEDRVGAVQGHESTFAYGPGFAVHRLLGHAQFIQRSGTGGERLLLQVSSDADLSKDGYPESGLGWTWPYCGRIYYLISEEALKSHRFAATYTHIEYA